MRYIISGYNAAGVISHQTDAADDAIKKAKRMTVAGFRDVFIRDTQTAKSYRDDYAALMRAPGQKAQGTQPI